MEQMPQEENIPEEDDSKKPSKAAIAAAALGAMIAAGGPADVAAEQGDARNTRSAHEYVMPESEGLKNTARNLVEFANRALSGGMPKLRAQEFIWNQIDMALGGRMNADSISKSMQIAKALIPLVTEMSENSPGAQMVIDRLNAISGSADPNSLENKAVRESLQNRNSPQESAPTNDGHVDPYSVVPKNRANW